MDSILLHACCGPCATLPIKLLKADGPDFKLLFFNPNIQPAEEYRLRLDNLSSLARAEDVELVTAAYQPKDWDAAIANAAGVFPLIATATDYQENLEKRRRRCRRCYQQRFRYLATLAAAEGHSAIATTLSISPYQFVDDIAEVLEQQAEPYGLASAFVDYRQGFAESQRLSREYGLYRQNYCGCRYSRQEAELERQARRQQRQDNSIEKETKTR